MAFFVQGQKDQLLHLEVIFSKTVQQLFLYFGIELPKTGNNELSNDLRFMLFPTNLE